MLQKKLWRTKKSTSKDKDGYLFSHKALAKVFRAKMLEDLTQAGLTLPENIPQNGLLIANRSFPVRKL